MSAFTANVDTLKVREDLFKEVKYFVTGNLDAKVKRHRDYNIGVFSFCQMSKEMFSVTIHSP